MSRLTRSALCAALFITVLIPSPVVIAQGASETESSKSGGASDESLREKTVYVPYDKLNEVFEKEGRGIFMPYREFLELWQRAQPRPEPVVTPPPPAEAVISGGRYVGKIEDNLARFEVEFRVEALKEKGWSVLRFDMGGAAVETAEVVPVDATPNDSSDDSKSQAPPLFVGSEKHYGVFFPRRGTYEVKLRMAVRVQSQPGQRSVQFGIPAVATSILDLTLPEENPDIEVMPANTATEVSVETGKTRIVAFLGNSRRVGITWSPHVRDVQREDTLFTATQNIRAYLGERVLRLNTAVDLQVLSQEINRIHLRIPENMQVVSVDGDGENIRQSTILKDQNLLEIKLHSAVRDGYGFRVGFERILEETPESLSVGFPGVEGVLRESGHVALGFDESLRVRVRSRKGLSQQDLGELPEQLRKGAQLGFRYLAHPLSLDLSVQEILPVVHGDSTSVVLFGVEEDLWIGWIDYRITRAGIFSMQIEVPDRWQIVSIADDNNTVEDYQSHPEENRNVERIQVNLKSRAIGNFRLHFSLSAEGSARSGQHVVRAPGLVGTQRDRGILGVGGPRSLRLTTGENIEKAIPADVQELFRAGILSRVPQDADASLAFKYNEANASVRVNLEERTTEIKLTSRRLVNVTENAVEIAHDLEYQIQFAAVDRLAFTAPSTLDERIQVSTQNYKERTVRPLGDGRSVWEIGLQRKELGIVTIKVIFAEDLKGLGIGQSREITLPLIRGETLGGAQVRSEEGTIAIRKEGSLEIRANVEKLEKIDSRELPPELAQGQIYEAYKFSEPEHSMALELTRHQYVDLANATVTLLSVKSHVSKERLLTSSATLIVQNFGRQYLRIGLPEEADVMSVTVNGTSGVRFYKDSESPDVYRIPLTGQGQVNASFPLLLVYRVQLDTEAMGTLGAFEITVPEVLDGVHVGKTQLKLYVPEDYVYVGWGGTLHRQGHRGGVWLPWSEIEGLVGVRIHRPVLASGSDSPGGPRFVAGMRVDLPTNEEGLPFNLQGFSDTGFASVWFVGRNFFNVLCVVVFILMLVAGIFVARQRPADSFWWIGGVAVLALLVAWLFQDELAKVFVSIFYAAAILLAGAILRTGWPRMRVAYAGWRDRRAEVALDPFIENSETVTTVEEADPEGDTAPVESPTSEPTAGDESPNENEASAKKRQSPTKKKSKKSRPRGSDGPSKAKE